jgi:hypothetical protein
MGTAERENLNDASPIGTRRRAFVPRTVHIRSPFRTFARTMSESRKQEKDFTKEVDEAIPEAEKIAKVHRYHARPGLSAHARMPGR